MACFLRQRVLYLPCLQQAIAQQTYRRKSELYKNQQKEQQTERINIQLNICAFMTDVTLL